MGQDIMAAFPRDGKKQNFPTLPLIYRPDNAILE